MFEYDGKQYRNLQEQVLANKEAIAAIVGRANIGDLGINIVSAVPLESTASLPTDYTGAYGDAYLVGTEIPYELYIWTRNENGEGSWFDWGPLNAPSAIPGPIGPQGIQGDTGTRGSSWQSQSGAPSGVTAKLNGDQALDTSTGNVYQFVNGIWQLTGNIRGPQGIQGIKGDIGDQGPIGLPGAQGPKGDQGQFIQIIGTLANTNQLPMPDSVPRSSAYLIPTSGKNHVYLLIGEGTSASPIQWYDAGAFGEGETTVTMDGTPQSSVELGYVPKISVNYQIGEDTTVSANGSEITVSNLQSIGYNINNEQIEGVGTIELPFASNGDVEFNVLDNVIIGDLSQDVWNNVREIVNSATPQEVQITAPSTSTNGQLDADQLNILQSNPGAYLKFNDEIYRLQDVQHEEGYLVYSHLGFENNTNVYMVKCITITISTRGWVLTTQQIGSGGGKNRYGIVYYSSGGSKSLRSNIILDTEETLPEGRFTSSTETTALDVNLMIGAILGNLNATSKNTCYPANGMFNNASSGSSPYITWGIYTSTSNLPTFLGAKTNTAPSVGSTDLDTTCQPSSYTGALVVQVTKL